MIKLKAVRLINWYGFNNVTMPIGDFTLIAGQNGNGKSVLLDAIKYALYGDTVFNKSTENTGSRTLPSYTRGFKDATSGTCIRPADQWPTIITHVVLEMFEEEMERSFVLGTVIETNLANNTKTNRYIIEDVNLCDLEHTYIENNDLMSYNGKELQKKYSLKLLDATDGTVKFTQRTGLRLSESQLKPFRRKLRSIMSYDPNSKIDQFIRESVLEAKNVDFSKLIEANNNIDSLKMTFGKIYDEIKELENISDLYESLQNIKDRIFSDDVKLVHIKLLETQAVIDEAKHLIEVASQQLVVDEDRLKQINAEDIDLRNKLGKVNDSLKEIDCTKAIDTAQDYISQLANQKDSLLHEKDRLTTFQQKLIELIEWIKNRNIEIPKHDVLLSLTSDQHTAAQKQVAVDAFFNVINNERDTLMININKFEAQIEKNNQEQNRQQRLIDDYKAKKTVFSDIPDFVTLKSEINKVFKNNGIQSEAKFACEYVKTLIDENWRDAIESFLGQRRYTILVEPEYYNIADDVLNRTRNKYARLFNTKLLMNKHVRIPEENSVVHYLEIINPVAKRYFEYQLGRIHAVDINEVRNYEDALSKEGRVSASMSSYFLDFNRIRSYSLGQETIDLNRVRAEKKLQLISQEINVMLGRKLQCESAKNYLETALNFFEKYDYDANQKYNDILKRYNEAYEELKQLENAQQHNQEYMALIQFRNQYEEKREFNENSRHDIYQSQAAMKTQIEANAKKKSKGMTDFEECERQMAIYQQQNYELYEAAVNSCDKWILNGKTGDSGPYIDRSRRERELIEVDKRLYNAQCTYNLKRPEDNRLETGADQYAAYEERKNQIWIDDFQEIKSKLAVQTKRYEEIFKNEFVLTVLKSCDSAQDDLKLINAELSRLRFTSKYEFEVKFVKDGSAYEKILEYARFLKEREALGLTSNQTTLYLPESATYTDEMGAELEKDIHSIINQIIASNDKEEIEKYADYRNYMTYEILITNDVLTKAKLSRQSGYNSGAEVQIPYLLILLSAILMVYNNKLNSTRLVFIDEPFAKMDASNVKIMLDFMKSQKLQMVFCAPDKTELIGNECNVILPVLKTSADSIEIGIIKFKDVAYEQVG